MLSISVKMRTYYIFVLLLVASCSQKKEATLVPTGEVTFDLGYAPDNRMTAIYHDDKENIDYIYFQSMKVDKMSFFTLDGKLKQETTLHNVQIEGNEVRGIVVVSLDTIIVCTNYPINKLYYLNANGDCWKTMTLDSIVPGKNFKYNISSDMKCINGSMLFYANWIGDDYLDSIDSRNEYLRYYINNMQLQPYFMRISNIYGDPKCQFGLNGFLKRFGKENHFMLDPGSYSIANDKIFVCVPYSDELFIVNNESLEVDKTVKIKSNYSTLGKAKIERIDNDYKPRHNAIDLTCGAIQEIQYDSNKHVYLVNVRHDVDKKNIDDCWGYITSSMIIIDEKFNKIDEHFLGATSYKFLTTKGLLVSGISDDDNYDRKKPKFTIYEINI